MSKQNVISIGDLSLSPLTIEILQNLQDTDNILVMNENIDAVIFSLQDSASMKTTSQEDLVTMNDCVFTLMRLKRLLTSLKPE